MVETSGGLVGDGTTFHHKIFSFKLSRTNFQKYRGVGDLLARTVSLVVPGVEEPKEKTE